MNIEDIIKKQVEESEKRIASKPKPPPPERKFDFYTKLKKGIIKKKPTHFTNAGVYEIKCTTNNKVYIGQSTEISKRWKSHIALLNAGEHHNKRLQVDWNLYGKEAFIFSILQKYKPVPHYHFDGLVSNLEKTEKRYILQAKAFCYNIWLEENTFISNDGTLFQGTFQK